MPADTDREPSQKHSAHAVGLEQLWQNAESDPAFAALLEQSLSDGTLSQVFMTHRDQLFAPVPVHMEGHVQPLGSKGLPYWTRSIRTTTETLLNFQEMAGPWSSQPEDFERGAELVGAFQERVSESFRDEIALGVLQTIRDNPALVSLVNLDGPLDRPTLRRTVGRWKCLNWTYAEGRIRRMLEEVAKPTRKALHQITTNLDVLSGAMDVTLFRANLYLQAAEQFARLLPLLRVKQGHWRQLALDLQEEGHLVAAGPVHAWCTRCSPAGRLVTVQSGDIVEEVGCTCCGRRLPALGLLRPAGPFAAALQQHDGLLGVAIGWHLRRNGIDFSSSVEIQGAEIDFLVTAGSQPVVIECKMNHKQEDERETVSKLLMNLKQLSEHAGLAQSAGVPVSQALCVVNLPASRVRALRSKVMTQWRGSASTASLQLAGYDEVGQFLPGGTRNG